MLVSLRSSLVASSYVRSLLATTGPCGPLWAAWAAPSKPGWASRSERCPCRRHSPQASPRLGTGSSRGGLPASRSRVAHCGAFERESVRAMNQSIADRIGHGGLTDRSVEFHSPPPSWTVWRQHAHSVSTARKRRPVRCSCYSPLGRNQNTSLTPPSGIGSRFMRNSTNVVVYG